MIFFSILHFSLSLLLWLVFTLHSHFIHFDLLLMQFYLCPFSTSFLCLHSCSSLISFLFFLNNYMNDVVFLAFWLLFGNNFFILQFKLIKDIFVSLKLKYYPTLMTKHHLQLFFKLFFLFLFAESTKSWVTNCSWTQETNWRYGD